MLIRLKQALILAAFPIAVLGSFLSMAAEPLYAAEGKINIVTTTTLFADLVRKVGGERVDVKSVASPKFNIHFIQPRPSDVRNVTKADLYVFYGLDIEAWSDPLLEAAGRSELFRGGARNLDLSAGIPLLEVPQGPLSRSMGDIHLFGNPHYQMNPENARIMAGNIAAKLKEIDPDGTETYDRNLADFLSKLDAKIGEWRALCSHCAGQEIISYHKDIVYFADFLGLKVNHYFEPKPGIPPTPKHLSFLESYMKEKGVKAIVTPIYYSRTGPEAVAARTGAKVAVICQNPGETEGTEDFFLFFDYNFKTIAEALR